MGSLNYGYLMDNYHISHNNINKSNCEKWHDDNINYELCKINVKSNKNKKQKNTPNEKAKDYETGHILISENDGNQYIVTESKNGTKRWKKV